MYKRIIHRTALPGRLFLCPEIVTHYARPLLVSVQTINQTLKRGGQLMYYHTCPLRGKFRPDERCDCLLMLIPFEKER